MSKINLNIVFVCVTALVIISVYYWSSTAELRMIKKHCHQSYMTLSSSDLKRSGRKLDKILSCIDKDNNQVDDCNDIEKEFANHNEYQNKNKKFFKERLADLRKEDYLLCVTTKLIALNQNET